MAGTPRQRPHEAVDCLAAADTDFHEAASWMLIGTSPIVSKAIGIPAQTPAQNLKVAISRVMNLIVIDPRRSQTAARATIHIQPRPGEDVAILTGMINIIIGEKLCDWQFLTENVWGFDKLAGAVSGFTPAYVAELCPRRFERTADARSTQRLQRQRHRQGPPPGAE